MSLGNLSIRWQLTLCYLLSLSFVLVVFSACLYGMIGRYLAARIDAELVEESHELAEELELTKTEQEFRRRFRQRFSNEAIFAFQVCEIDGTIRFGSAGLSEVSLPHPAELSQHDFHSLSTISLAQNQRWRILSRSLNLPDGPFVIHVLAPCAAHDSQLAMLLSLLALNGLLAVVLSSFLGYWISQRVMSPILGITRFAERISSENLSERVPVRNPNDELGRLAITLNRTFDRLNNSISEIRRFTADAAHELRTPLAVIQTETEVAVREGQRNGQDANAILNRVAEVTLSETRRLSNLVDQLLTLSRHDSGFDSPAFEEVSLRALLLDVCESMHVVIKNKGQTLKIGELTEQTILGDDTMLSQLFFNLLENAMKYTPSGGTISVSSKPEGESIVVIVEDTGVGIAPEHIESIFQRFYRVDASRQTRGTGLGLAICRAIVIAHGGQIHVESQPGQGTRFTVRFPEKNRLPS